MYTAPINFKGLDYSNVSTLDREVFLKKDLKAIEILGDYYDIKLTSTYAEVPDFAAIDVDVKPLKDNLSFFKKLFRPIGKATFMANYTPLAVTEETVLQKVEEAIVNLGKKLHK